MIKLNARKTNDIWNKKDQKEQKQNVNQKFPGESRTILTATTVTSLTNSGKEESCSNSCIHSYFMHYVISKSDYTLNEIATNREEEEKEKN